MKTYLIGALGLALLSTGAMAQGGASSGASSSAIESNKPAPASSTMTKTTNGKTGDSAMDHRSSAMTKNAPAMAPSKTDR